MRGNALSIDVFVLGQKAKKAAATMANLDSTTKNEALLKIAAGLLANQDRILAANRGEVTKAKANGLSDSMTERLLLNPDRIAAMVEGLREIVRLEDPVGSVEKMWRRPNGLEIGLIRVPLGVVAIIYEARPNVTVDATALCLKTGNAVILRGGSEALRPTKFWLRSSAKHCGIRRFRRMRSNCLLLQSVKRRWL